MNKQIAQDIKAVSVELAKNSELRNGLGRCPLCNSNIADRTVTIYKELIDALYQVYCWCGREDRHEFETKEIRHFLSRNNYARFGDLVRFGGIVYKPKGDEGKKRKAHFGINMERAWEFFKGQRKIPIQININQITNEIIDSKYVSVRDFPKLEALLDGEGIYDYKKLL